MKRKKTVKPKDALCLCRSHYKRCNNPLDVCLMLNDAADKYMDEPFASQALGH